jgi:hypothetical protein
VKVSSKLLWKALIDCNCPSRCSTLYNDGHVGAGAAAAAAAAAVAVAVAAGAAPLWSWSWSRAKRAAIRCDGGGFAWPSGLAAGLLPSSGLASSTARPPCDEEATAVAGTFAAAVVVVVVAVVVVGLSGRRLTRRTVVSTTYRGRHTTTRAMGTRAPAKRAKLQYSS